jgi:hypothetical protein
VRYSFGIPALGEHPHGNYVLNLLAWLSLTLDRVHRFAQAFRAFFLGELVFRRYAVFFQGLLGGFLVFFLCSFGFAVTRETPCRPSVGVDSEEKFFREELLNWKSKGLAS